MDFSKLIELLGDNAEAVEFVKKAESEQTESKAKMVQLAEEADKHKAAAAEVEKYKAEAKEAFTQRDKLKEQLAAAGGKEPDKELLAEIEKFKLQTESLKGQILAKEQNEVLADVLSGMEFRGEGEAKERLKGIVKAELAKGLQKHPELGFVYTDDKGNPRRNPEDATKFLTPKDMVATKSMKDFLSIISGVGSQGDGFEGGQGGGGATDGTPKTSKDYQREIFKSIR